MKRILYLGYLAPGQTSLQRMKALESLGITTGAIDFLGPRPGAPNRFGYRMAGYLFRRGLPLPLPDPNGVNRQLCEKARQGWDGLWLDKPLVVQPSSVACFRACNPRAPVIAYSPDDMAGRHNQSQQFLALLPHLDVFITTKSYNVEELRALGCRQVIFVDNAFDPATHRPMSLTRNDRKRLGGPVGFIGVYEPERARIMNQLAAAGLKIRIWGPPSWSRFRNPHPNLRIERREVNGDEYARAICAFEINLAFLRKMNRDLQTTRSIEIPACGAFMLAERTDEHTRLFDEDKEAAFFSNADELLAKIRYYLDHPGPRKRIAAAGRARCLRDGYDNASRLRCVLEAIGRERLVVNA